MKIIQITDTHLLPPGGLLHGTDPTERLTRVINDVAERHADADLVVFTGDLCDHGDPSAYARLRELLRDLPGEVRLLLGNHDARPAFREAFPDQPVDANGFVQSYLDTPHGRLLFLDTLEPGQIGGRYCAARLAWLDVALAGAGTAPVTVFLHHPPIHAGIAHFDPIGLHDAEALMARLRAHRPGVRHLVFGHLHVPLCGTTADGIGFSSGQACALQFVTDLDDPSPYWTAGHPGYRILRLDTLGLRLYAAEVGQPVLGRARPCAGP